MGCKSINNTAMWVSLILLTIALISSGAEIGRLRGEVAGLRSITDSDLMEMLESGYEKAILKRQLEKCQREQAPKETSEADKPL